MMFLRRYERKFLFYFYFGHAIYRMETLTKVCKINVIEYLTGNIYNYENTWKNNWSGVYYLNMKYET